MNEQTKSLVRHVLTAVGFLLGMFGVGKLTGVIDILSANLDSLWSAIMAVVGVVTSILGFFRDKSRFAENR